MGKKIDFTQAILDLTGKPISAGLDQDGNTINLTVSTVCIQALGEEKGLTIDQKKTNTRIAEQLYESDSVQLTVKELATLVDVVERNIDHYLVCTKTLRVLDHPIPDDEQTKIK